MRTVLAALYIAGVLLTPPAFCRAADEVLQEIIVQDGDTLWGVANKYLKDPQSWPQLLRYNTLPSDDPNVLLPGMRLRVPILMVKKEYRSATLVQLVNQVLVRRKDKSQWDRAQLNMQLLSEDGLRTMTKSLASVKFYSGELVNLDQNSLVILRPEKKQDEVELLSGAVRASRSKVISADTAVMPKITPRGKRPDYKTRIKPNKTTLVEVYAGSVDVTAQGTTVTLNKGFGTEVKYLKAPSMPFELPPQIQLTDDEKQTLANALTLPALTQNAPPRPADAAGRSPGRTRVIGNIITKLHIQITADREFKQLVYDKTLPLSESQELNFRKMNLPDGTYYFHVAYLDELGLEGPYSEPHTFVIDTTPPPLTITSPEEGGYVEEEAVTISGRTEPGATLTLDEEIAGIRPDGGFALPFMTRRGRNTATLTATDRAGNAMVRKISFSRVARGSAPVKKQKDPALTQKKRFLITPGSIAMGVLSISVIVGVALLIAGL